MTAVVTLDTSQRLFSEMLDSQKADAPFVAILEKNSRIPGQLATNIYRNNSIGTRKRALQAIYPIIEKILGVQCFDKLAYDFVTAAPSMDSDLNLYGDVFPGFMQKLTQNELAFSELPYLEDLATLEWLYHKAYYAPDDLAFTAKQFAGIDSSVKLDHSRSLFFMNTLFPVYDIWQNHQGNEGVKEVQALTDQEFILIFRKQGHPVVQHIDREEWSILQSIKVMKELGGVIQGALADGVDIEKKLPVMIEQGWIRLNPVV